MVVIIDSHVAEHIGLVGTALGDFLFAADSVRPALGLAIGRATTQGGAEKIFLNVGLVRQRAGIHPHHLADFFVERHLREQGVGFGIVFREQRGGLAHGGGD